MLLTIHRGLLAVASIVINPVKSILAISVASVIFFPRLCALWLTAEATVLRRSMVKDNVVVSHQRSISS